MSERTLFLFSYLLFSVPIAHQPHKQFYVRLHLPEWLSSRFTSLCVTPPSSIKPVGTWLLPKGQNAFLFILSYQQNWVSEQLDLQHLWGALRYSSEMLRKSHCQEAEPSAQNGGVGLPVVGGTGNGGAEKSETGLLPKWICHSAIGIVQHRLVCLKETLSLFRKSPQANNGVIARVIES